MLSRRAGSLVAMVAACGLAGSGLALATDDSKEPVRAFDDAPTAMTESISEEQRGFALLRRAQDSGDVMPAWVAAQIGNPDVGGKNVKLARAFATPTGKGWVSCRSAARIVAVMSAEMPGSVHRERLNTPKVGAAGGLANSGKVLAWRPGDRRAPVQTSSAISGTPSTRHPPESSG
jgi:hypothetical protein